MSELVDLVNAQGEIVDTGVDRSVAETRTDAFMRIIILVITNGLGEVYYHERHDSKRVDSNKIDHVCGAVLSGETPEDACMREAGEELGIKPKNLIRRAEGVNIYGKYRILFSGECETQPVVDLSAKEANFASVASIQELHDMHSSGEFDFVADFFTDYDMAMAV